MLNKGSNVHYFLVKALEKAGLRYTDVQTAFLPPPEARAAFESGRVDAWAIWDPFLTAAELGTGAKVLTSAKGLAGEHFKPGAARPFSQFASPVRTENRVPLSATLSDGKRLGPS